MQYKNSIKESNIKKYTNYYYYIFSRNSESIIYQSYSLFINRSLN